MAERKTAARRQAFSASYDLSAHHQQGGWLRSFPYLRPDLLRARLPAKGRYHRMDGHRSLVNGVPHSHARENARRVRQQEALQRRRNACPLEPGIYALSEGQAIPATLETPAVA